MRGAALILGDGGVGVVVVCCAECADGLECGCGGQRLPAPVAVLDVVRRRRRREGEGQEGLLDG